MPTSIANLWTPSVWIEGLRERAKNFPAFINSGSVAENPQFSEIASGAGVSANLPFFKDFSGQLDEIQVEVSPPSDQILSAGIEVAPILNRVHKLSVTGLSADVSGSDPVAEILAQLAFT